MYIIRTYTLYSYLSILVLHYTFISFRIYMHIYFMYIYQNIYKCKVSNTYQIIANVIYLTRI